MSSELTEGDTDKTGCETLARGEDRGRDGRMMRGRGSFLARSRRVERKICKIVKDLEVVFSRPSSPSRLHPLPSLSSKSVGKKSL